MCARAGDFIHVGTYSVPAYRDHGNEDRVVSTRVGGVLVDGAGLPRELRAGCLHDVSWYADRLATCMADAMAVEPDLRGALRQALELVAAAHGSSCDLASGSPSATIAAWRTPGEQFEVIVLGDASAFVRLRDGHTRRVTDDRIDDVVEPLVDKASAAGATADEMRDLRRRAVELHRNRPGGFWCCQHDAAAAIEAITLDVPIDDVTGIVLASDGATRGLDLFDLHDVQSLVDRALDQQAPAIAAEIRSAERDQATRLIARARKVHDDLSIAGWTAAAR